MAALLIQPLSSLHFRCDSPDARGFARCGSYCYDEPHPNPTWFELALNPGERPVNMIVSRRPLHILAMNCVLFVALVSLSPSPVQAQGPAGNPPSGSPCPHYDPRFADPPYCATDLRVNPF